MNRYTVTFYQCAVTGIEPEQYRTRREANRAAAGFLLEFESARQHGHRYTGSIYRDGYARLVDRMGGTEAAATIHDQRAKQ